MYRYIFLNDMEGGNTVYIDTVVWYEHICIAEVAVWAAAVKVARLRSTICPKHDTSLY